MATSATNGWSVNNIMRKFGATTKASVLSAWVAAESAKPANVVLPTAADVTDGVTYLVANNFATYDVGTDVITPTHTDASGKPARLRRVPGNEFALELLPAGAAPQEGT